jgi:hypothetical protein
MTAPIADYLSMQGWDGLSVRFFVQKRISKTLIVAVAISPGLKTFAVDLYHLLNRKGYN